MNHINIHTYVKYVAKPEEIFQCIIFKIQLRTYIHTYAPELVDAITTVLKFDNVDTGTDDIAKLDEAVIINLEIIMKSVINIHNIELYTQLYSNKLLRTIEPVIFIDLRCPHKAFFQNFEIAYKQ